MWLLPWLLLLLLLSTGCRRTVSGPLPQRGYLWQRVWTPAVSEAVEESAKHLNGVVLLGAEVRFVQNKPSVIRANIDWAAVKRAGVPCAIALRVAPFGGPFVADDLVGKAITDEAKALLADMKKQGVEVTEFQLDFDCAQKKLAGYRVWLRAVRGAVRPVPLVITTLPAWLGEPEFEALVGDADAYVLQVHSVPLRQQTQLCDPAQAREWVARAGRIGRPFFVALPTYRCVAGYAPDGHLLSVAMDAVQPAWPPGTSTLEIGADAGELAGLVRVWQTARPSAMRGLLWYRVPVATDLRNWCWPTLDAVMAGLDPVRLLEVKTSGSNPIDLSIYNAGQGDEPLACSITVTWKGGAPSAADALPGWTLTVGEGRAVFSSAEGARLRLPPGEKRNIGWLRYETETPIEVTVAEHRNP
ncbi:MAG TPA: DUF3142 domain-containing protein [Chthoniobacteraceae bacterium]|jgi:hypothetical protein|nr:DUF3142 domain-containing protein [Chthoniobacteraceae bacterium]